MRGVNAARARIPRKEGYAGVKKKKRRRNNSALFWLRGREDSLSAAEQARRERRKEKLSFFRFSLFAFISRTMAAVPPTASPQRGELGALDSLELPQDLKAKVKRKSCSLQKDEHWLVGRQMINGKNCIFKRLSSLISSAEAGTASSSCPSIL